MTNDIEYAVCQLREAQLALRREFGSVASIRVNDDTIVYEDDFGVHRTQGMSVLVALECGCRKYIEVGGKIEVITTYVCRGDRPPVNNPELPSVISYEDLPF